MRLTVGPLPPAVYWRRRAIVLSGVLLALFLVAQACMSASASPENRSSDEPTGSPSPSPTRVTERTTPPSTQSSEVPSATPTASPPDPDACTDDEMLITAEAAQTEFASGTTVRFTIRIRNDADRTCSRDIGGDLRELYLRAGEGASNVWSSRDCNPPTGTDTRELTPGFEQEHWVDWKGLASDACDGDKPAGEPVPPGDYELVARLGTAYSEPLAISIVGPVG
jgi:hypothetical protein